MLPEDGHEHENGADEYDGESDLGDGARGEGLDFSLAARVVFFFMPAGESSQEKEADESEDYCDNANPDIISVCVGIVGGN